MRTGINKSPEARNNVYFTLEIMEDIMAYGNNQPRLAVKMRNRGFDKTVYLWDFEKFKSRVYLMQEWYESSRSKSSSHLQLYLDPWTDLTDEEVLFYMEDDQEHKDNQK